MKDTSPSITILAIDEEAEVLVRIAAVLQEAGYTCLCARDADAARQAAQRVRPDLIIANINLAGRSGITVCDEIKQATGIREVPVMFLSAAQVPDVIRRSFAAGTYFLRKPFHAAVLLQLVEKTRLTITPRPVAPAPASISPRQPTALESPMPAMTRTTIVRASALAAK